MFAPLTASTYGSGELLRAALDADVRTIVFGVGGSATTDGGAGMLSALGARFLDADGEPVAPGGGGLADLASADLSGLDPRLTSVELVLASDVDNPLTGPKGAPAVYGPQKGASPDDVTALDAALAHFAEVLETSVARGPPSTPQRPVRVPRVASGTALCCSAPGSAPASRSCWTCWGSRRRWSGPSW